MKYINSFSSLIPALQGNRAIRKVEKMRQSGEIETEQEYSDMLAQILGEISGNEYAPTFKLRPFKPGYSSSENYNLMMDEIKDDLEVAFIELNNIYSIIQAHEILFKDKVINDLYSTIEQLEVETNRLSIIANPNNSFKEADFNTFAGDLYRSSSIDPYAKELFYDRREDSALSAGNIASANPEEELISLPFSKDDKIKFSKIQVVETNTTGSDYNIQLVDSNIDSILSGENSTGWTRNILKIDVLSEGAQIVLDADLGDKRLVNYLLIKPVANFPSILKQITYINENNQEVPLPAETYFGRSLSGPVKIPFEDIIARRFIIKFYQESSVLFSYDPSVESLTIDDVRRNTSLKANAEIVKDDLKAQIKDVDLAELLPISESKKSEIQVVYKYSFGFTEISTGLSGYKNKGFFISKAYRKDATGLLALEVEEINMSYLDQPANTTALSGSFEYDFVKKDYNSRKQLIASREFPVLPIGMNSVLNERLHFNAIKKTIALRFLGHSLNNSGSSVTLFRNNVELVRGADWTFADRSDASDLSDDTLKDDIFETKITILHVSDVIAKGVYTCSYIPRHVSEQNSVIMYKGVTYSSTNITEHLPQANGEDIAYSDIYLKIAIRNNSFYANKSPRLASYKILSSPFDAKRSTI
jgi:hypothetical protein